MTSPALTVKAILEALDALEAIIRARGSLEARLTEMQETIARLETLLLGGR